VLSNLLYTSHSPRLHLISISFTALFDLLAQELMAIPLS